jgi:hypothetical protein
LSLCSSFSTFALYSLCITSSLSLDNHIVSTRPVTSTLTSVLRNPSYNLETSNPNENRSLCTSIIGQQVSWLAARAINHKFRRLFDRGLPEKATVGAGAGGDAGGGEGGGEGGGAGEGGLDG